MATFGNGETPEKANMKGDHLVGKYYVKFNQEYNKELTELRAQGYSEDECINKSRLNKEAKELYLDGNPMIVKLLNCGLK